MKKKSRLQIFNKLWLLSIIYLLLAMLSFNTIFAEAHFPIWLEILLKVISSLAFTVVLAWPLINLLPNFSASSRIETIRTTAYLSCAGYGLMFAGLVYVKLKTCNQFVTHNDERWHCNVEGTGIVVYFILIPIFAGLVAIIFSFCSSLIARIMRSRK